MVAPPGIGFVMPNSKYLHGTISVNLDGRRQRGETSMGQNG